MITQLANSVVYATSEFVPGQRVTCTHRCIKSPTGFESEQGTIVGMEWSQTTGEILYYHFAPDDEKSVLYPAQPMEPDSLV
jgi:hypothetical protein